MSAEQTTTLVQRRARTAREAQAARTMSLARALRLTAAKQADQLMGLPLGTLSVTQRTLSAEDIPSRLEDASLMLLMDGAGDQVAAAILDPILVSGLIQQQTMGKVLAPPKGGGRRDLTLPLMRRFVHRSSRACCHVLLHCQMFQKKVRFCRVTVLVSGRSRYGRRNLRLMQATIL